jgi:outer membrane protein insertion porin family
MAQVDRVSVEPAGPRRLARAGLVAALALLLVFARGQHSALAAAPAERIVTQIQIEGNVSITAEQIRAKLLSRPGRPFDQDKIEADLHSLLATKWFSDAKAFFEPDASGKSGVLIFKVVEMTLLTHVEFRGRSKISLKDIEESTGLKVGARADPMRTRLAVKQVQHLYEEKGYELAEVQLLEGGNAGDTRVVMSIFEGPKARVAGVAFEGNTYVSDAVLRTKITSRPAILGLIGGRFHRDTVDDDRRKLLEYYQGQGFFEAKVTPVTKPGDSLGSQQVTFVIWEGVQYKVRNLLFDGNKKLTSAQLKEGLVLHSGQPFSEIYREVDRKALEQKYFSIGCIDTRIAPEPKYTDSPGVIDLVYRIEEGEPYLTGEILVRGNARTKEKVIIREANQAGLLPGERLDPNRLELYKKRLENTGFFSKSNQAGGKPIEIKIVNRRPHERPYFGEAPMPDMSGVGLARLQDPGPGPEGSSAPPIPPTLPVEPLAPGPGPASVVPFGSGGMFDQPPTGGLPPILAPPPGADAPPIAPPRVSAEGLRTPPVGAGEPPGDFPSLPGGNMTDPGPDRQDPFPSRSYADIVTQVDEAPTGNFMLGVSANSYSGLLGQVSITERNFDLFNVPRSFRELFSGQAFRGAGQLFQVSLMPGTQINRAMATFSDPYVFDLPISFTSIGYVFQRVYPDFTESRGGGRFSLGRQFGTQTYADVAFRVEDVNFFGYRSPAPADFLAASGHTLLTSLRPSLRFDNRNNPFAPNKGQYLEFAFEQGWGSFTFPKATVEGRTYFTLGHRPDGTGKRVLKLRGSFGVAGRDTPVYERFYAGDFQSMRGFAYRGVGPHILGVNVGGIMSALGSLEYQFPLLANDQLHQVIFTDFGTVEPDYRFTTFRATVGTGLRIMISQLGPYPLAFDIGFPVAKADGDRTRVFAFFMSQF